MSMTTSLDPAGGDTVRAQWGPVLAALGTLVTVSLLGLAVSAYVALRTSPGLHLDDRISNAVSSPALAQYRLHVELRSWTHWTIFLLMLALMVLTLVRHRFHLALSAVVVVVGATVTSDFLQTALFTRPGASPAVNGLPSRHMTLAFSIALAAVIVAPPLWRLTVAIGVSAAGAVVGVALVLGRWHRPSDVIAAALVCVVWAALGMLAAALVRRPPPPSEDFAPVHLGALIGASMGGVLLVSWGLRPQPGLNDLWLGIISLGSIGLVCAVSIAAVAYIADRHLG